MAVQHDIAELLENIRKELPERARDLYEEAVNRAMDEQRKRGRQVARTAMRRAPYLRDEHRRQQEEEGALAIFALIIGFIGGAALMYLFDPERGERRRVLLTAQLERTVGAAQGNVETAADQVEAKFNRAVDQASDTASEVRGQVKQAADSVQDSAKRAQGQVSQVVDQAADAVKSTAQRAEDQVSNQASKVTGSASKAASGATAQATSAATGAAAAISNETLAARVRTEIGRSTRNPGTIQVTADGGTVTLTGKILASEAQPLVQKIRAIDGVKSVEDRLEVHDAPENRNSQPNDLSGS